MCLFQTTDSLHANCHHVVKQYPLYLISNLSSLPCLDTSASNQCTRIKKILCYNKRLALCILINIQIKPQLSLDWNAALAQQHLHLKCPLISYSKWRHLLIKGLYEVIHWLENLNKNIFSIGVIDVSGDSVVPLDASASATTSTKQYVHHAGTSSIKCNWLFRRTMRHRYLDNLSD